MTSAPPPGPTIHEEGKNMESYIAPKMEIIVFENEDLIVTSGCGCPDSDTRDISGMGNG
jgi:hypothetical protein